MVTVWMNFVQTGISLVETSPTHPIPPLHSLCVSSQNRMSFSIPDEVPWPRLAQGFSEFFFAHCGRGLTEQQLDYLGRKLLGKGMLPSSPSSPLS